MGSIPEYQRGQQDGIRAAVTWLHERANEMNDPHAKVILNSAATNLGWAWSHRLPDNRIVTVAGPIDFPAELLERDARVKELGSDVGD